MVGSWASPGQHGERLRDQPEGDVDSAEVRRHEHGPQEVQRLQVARVDAVVHAVLLQHRHSHYITR